MNSQEKQKSLLVMSGDILLVEDRGNNTESLVQFIRVENDLGTPKARVNYLHERNGRFALGQEANIFLFGLEYSELDRRTIRVRDSEVSWAGISGVGKFKNISQN